MWIPHGCRERLRVCFSTSPGEGRADPTSRIFRIGGRESRTNALAETCSPRQANYFATRFLILGPVCYLVYFYLTGLRPPPLAALPANMCRNKTSLWGGHREGGNVCGHVRGNPHNRVFTPTYLHDKITPTNASVDLYVDRNP